jgi:hypothetical protein
MTYSSPGPSCIDTKDADGSCGPVELPEQPTTASDAMPAPTINFAKYLFFLAERIFFTSYKPSREWPVSSGKQAIHAKSQGGYARK